MRNENKLTLEANILKRVLIAIGLFTIVVSCQEENECEISFERDLKPITEKACTGYCHSSFGHFTNYINLKEVVDNGVLKEKLIVSREMPLYPQSITEEEREMFACWIEAGGPDN